MNSGSKAPKPPDPVKTAAAQTGSNQSTAIYEQMLNMQDQRTPYGSVTWQPAGTWSYKDPTTGKVVEVPKFMASTVLSPSQQGLLDQEQQFDARYNQIALDQAARVKDTLSTPFDYNPGAHEAWAGGLYDKLNRDSISRGQDELQQSLANRGLNIGTKAYDDAMRSFTEGNQRARDAFMLDSYGTGMNTALTIRNQPLKEGVTLMGAGQITEPTWLQGPQSGVAGTDVAGITNAAYAQQAARAQAQQQSQAGVWGALGQIGGAALGGWLASDERVKNVKGGKQGLSKLGEKEWSYKGSDQVHRTPTAQDVERQMPEAVAEVDGIKYVDWKRVPGGEKYARDIERERQVDPRLYGGPGRPITDLPDGHMVKRGEMRLPPDDPNYNIRKALPKATYQDAGLKRGGLQRLGRSAA
jgi:hypothetical protein